MQIKGTHAHKTADTAEECGNYILSDSLDIQPVLRTVVNSINRCDY